MAIEYLFATEEQKELVNLATSILKKELPPEKIRELEKANGGRGGYPLDAHKKLAEAGFAGFQTSEKWGGLDLDNVTVCLLMEEMAKIEAGFTFNFFGATEYLDAINSTQISQEEKEHWAKRLLSGDSLIAFALTEPQAGSDASAIRTTAVKDGDEWVLNGTKCFCTNGPVADLFIIMAWTDKTKSAGKGITAFFVEKDRGIKVGAPEDKLGLKLSCTSEVYLDNVRVPDTHIIGELGSGFKFSMSGIDRNRVCTYATCLGIAQAALDHAAEYAKVRQTFGKPIIDHDRVADILVGMQIRTNASRALLYYAANRLDQGYKDSGLSSSVKNFVAESTTKTVLDAMQVFGGYGYMKDYPIEKLVRDAKIYEIFEGPTQINNLVIARDIKKKYQ